MKQAFNVVCGDDLRSSRGLSAPCRRAPPSVFHGCFIVNEYSTKSTKEYEKSTDSVQGQLFQEKSQPDQERQSIFLEVIVNDFST